LPGLPSYAIHMEIELYNHNIIYLLIVFFALFPLYICDVVNLEVYVKKYVVELYNG